MQVEIPCEKCLVALRVPPEAAGHRARCPACGHVFVVPRVDQLMEDTVSGWLARDLEDLIEDRDRQEAHQGAATEETSDVEPPGAILTATQPAAAPPPASSPAHDGEGHGSHDSRARSSEPPDRRLWPLRPHGQSGTAAPQETDRISSGDPDIEIIHEPVKRPHTHKPPPPKEEIPSPGEQVDDHSEKKSKYPRNLHVDERVPHLVVAKVSAAGVLLCFDSAWLTHDGFRASMPIRCAFSGTTSTDKLIARPMVFADRALNSAAASLEQIIAVHENRTLGTRSTRDITKSMGMIEGMPRPFAYAMPYYVAAKFSHLSLHCRTRDRTSGGITCEIIVPDSACALDWLARVNGVCGEEYLLLERDVSLLHGDAWQNLREEVRQRIEVWCKFQPREVMRHYFSDADFGRRDEGLAGLVVTDQRLVYCKYHHKGQVPLDAENTSLVAKVEGKWAGLTLRTSGDLQRMVKLHRADVDRLADALKSHGRLTMQISE